MKKILLLLSCAFLIVMLSTCDEDDPGINDEDEKPEPTMVGLPNGIAVSKTIGAAGGFVAIDGEVELEIPVGALSVDTEISIQPIINNAPNGKGNAYRLSPDGIDFAKPVKLTFPATFAENGPPLTGIAFQDEDRIWYSNGKLSWNEVDQTVTTETNHFSDWTTFDQIIITCEGCQGTVELYELKESESGDFKFKALLSLGSDDLLQPLAAGPLILQDDQSDYDLIVKEWFANGDRNGASGVYGTISQTPTGCIYKAPDKAPKREKNPVSLLVTLKDLKYKDPRTGTIFNDLQLSTNVKIEGELKYDATITFRDANILSGGLVGATFVLDDVATLRVLIKNDSVFLSDFKNFPGTVTPSTKIDPYGNQSTSTSTTFLGPLNFTEGSGFVGDFLPGKTQLWLTLEGKTETPSFDWVGATGGEVTIASETGWFQLFPILDLTQEAPTWEVPGSGSIKVKLTEVE